MSTYNEKRKKNKKKREITNTLRDNEWVNEMEWNGKEQGIRYVNHKNHKK